jgi:AraC-like DNA-binding protein
MPANILIPVRKFQRLLDYMVRIGLDAESMMAPLGITPEQLLTMPGDQQLPGSDYSALYRNAVRQMQTLRKPLPWGAGVGSEAFELMCHCIISCKTLGAALQQAQRYDDLLYPMIGYRVCVEQVGEEFELHYHVRAKTENNIFVPEDWDRSEHFETVARASGLMVWYCICGWLIGRSIDLTRVDVGAPPVTDAYREGLLKVFQCPLEFDCTDNKLVAPASYLEQRLVHTPESLQEFLSNAVYELISINTRPTSTSAAIRSLIKLDFSDGLASFEQMAENLHMSESSLRRRLLKEETSYQKIKDQVRCEIALEHLRKEETRINDLAELLGFTEPSSFVRSFRSWMGVTPKAWRDSMKVPRA